MSYITKNMGGDDLESEDEYLDQSWAKTTKQSDSISTTIDATNNGDSTIDTANSRHKRKVDDTETTSNTALHSDNDINDDNDDDGNALNKKQKTASTPRNLLLNAGRGIENENADVQAVFLWTCFRHFRKLQQSNEGDTNDNNDENDGSSVTIDENDKFQPSQFATPNDTPTTTTKPYEKSLTTFLKNGVLPSNKRLKKWKHTRCPMVLILCLSARRAVSLLKDLSPLNVRVAKLFAKHMNVTDQTAMLELNSYGVAVGTPHRCLTLFRNGALVLDRTELVLVDCYEDGKGFTVCTMNDTAPDLMELIDVGVLPQIRRRKTLKFAMF